MLYEVITVQLSTDGEPNFGYGVPPEGCCSAVTLARRGVEAPPVLAWSRDSRRIATVITSYSIHYTKLYDLESVFLRGWVWRCAAPALWIELHFRSGR